MSGPGEGTWECHVCGEQRPDAQISVFTAGPMDLAGAVLTIHVRYCNDRSDCRRGAPLVAERWKPSSLRSPVAVVELDGLPGDPAADVPTPERDEAEDILLPWEQAAEERLSDTTADLHVEESGRLARPPRWRWPFSRQK
jgi:hypothetical protein